MTKPVKARSAAPAAPRKSRTPAVAVSVNGELPIAVNDDVQAAPAAVVQPLAAPLVEPLIAPRKASTPAAPVPASASAAASAGTAAVLEGNADADADAMAGLEAEHDDDEEPGEQGLIQEPRFWQDDGWTAKVHKNEDDDGWAVAMTLDGEPEPALVGPWTMGRNKKDPKPLDANAFSVLVKTAYEVRRRHEQALHAMLNKNVTVDGAAGRIRVTLEIVPDEYDPHAFLRAFDELGEALAEVRVQPDFKLNTGSANSWIANEYRRPGGGY